MIVVSIGRLPALILLCLSPPTQAIIGGTPDLADQFPAVVSLKTTLGQDCTATKTSARQFLTAARCVIDVPTGRLAAPSSLAARSW